MCLKGIVVIVTVGQGGVNKARKYGKVCCCKYSKNIKKSSTFVRDRHRYLLHLHGNMFEKIFLQFTRIICGIFCPNSAYVAIIRIKFSTNCDAYFVERHFQTLPNMGKAQFQKCSQK